MVERSERVLIEDDLARERSRRRAHFLPALAVVVLAFAGALAAMARPDLLAQAPVQLSAQVVVWLLCLGALPAIGVGIWFPGPVTRLSLLATGVLASVVSSTGWPVAHAGSVPWDYPGIDHCVGIVVVIGALLLALGVSSGAFWARRQRSAAYWLSASVALASLNLVTWICPKRELVHVMPSHLAAAVVMGILVVACAAVIRDRRRPS